LARARKYERLIDEDKKPTERSILVAIGIRSSKLWKRLRAVLKVNYDFKPEFHFYGKKYGWCSKYTRKGKTLCVLFPEMKAFTTLVVLGKKEVVQFEENATSFNEDTQRLFKTAHKYLDGKWLYKRVLNKSDLEDVISLIRIKRKSKTK
jgi:hypothetical protein